MQQRMRSRRGVHPIAIGAVFGAIVAILMLAAFTAQGAPTSPQAKLSASLTPGTAQTLQLTLTSQMASVTPPNSIYLLGGHFLYSITQTNAQNGISTIEQGQTVAFNVVNGSGSIYTVAATVTITTSAICSGANCDSLVLNLTVTAQAIVSTYWGVLLSPTSTVVFSSSPGIGTVQSAQPVQMQSYYAELVGPIAGAAVAGLIGAGLVMRNHALIAIGGITLAVLALALLAGL